MKASLAVAALIGVSACGGSSSSVNLEDVPQGGAETFEELATLANMDSETELISTPDGGIPTEGEFIYRGYATVFEVPEDQIGFGSSEDNVQLSYVALGRSTITVDFAKEQGVLVADKFYELDVSELENIEDVDVGSLISAAIAGTISGTISVPGDKFGGSLTKSNGTVQAYDFEVDDTYFYGPTGEQAEVVAANLEKQGDVYHGFLTTVTRTND